MRIPKTEYAAIVALYNEIKTAAPIAEKYGVSGPTVYYILDKMGVARPDGLVAARRVNRLRGRVNHQAFDTLTDASAYWIGFLTADGCVYDSGKSQMQIQLSSSLLDLEHMKEFSRFIGCNPPRIVHRSRGDSEVIVTACSDHMAEVLSGYGIIPRKTFSCEYKGEMCGEFEWSYVRGLLDGDGCLYTNREAGSFRAMFSTGSPRFAEQLSRRLLELGLPSKTYQAKSCYGIKCFDKSAKQLCSNIYTCASVCLSRKKEKYERYLCWENRRD